MAGPSPDERPSFRPDLEGLRAVAVILIVMYHAGVAGFSGGYVGVDVFFVISGFLITGLLSRELRQTGGIDLWSFYARRARRILPASFLVLGVTLLVSVALLSPIRLWHVAEDIAAAALYVPNLLFARQTTDYLHPVRITPVVHYWSLGVEEQFYLVWPAFLLVVHRLGARTTPRLAFSIGAAVAGSLALSLIFTALKPSYAFFLLPTRAWELGAGALLALIQPLGWMKTQRATTASFVGLAMVAMSATLFGNETPFPGSAALVPVLGTTLIIAAGRDGSDALVIRVLGWMPFRWVGRISYSLYLWHWPVFVLGAAALGSTLPPAELIPLEILVALLLASATYVSVEDPLRRGRFLGTRPRRNLSAALSVSVAVALISFSLGHAAVARFEPRASVLADTSSDDLLAGLIPAAGPTADGPLPADLTPSLLNPLEPVGAPLPAPACSLEEHQTVVADCVYGDPASTTTVVLFGDSHAVQWFPAVEQLALTNHWRLVSLAKAGCPYEDVTVMIGSRAFTECDAWRAAALARITSEHPALVLMAGNHRITPGPDGTALTGAAAFSTMLDGAKKTVSLIQSVGAKVAVIADTPQVPFDPVDCLSSNADHVLRCAVPRSIALDLDWFAAERATAVDLNATFIDSSAWVCASDPCPLVLGRFLVFRDTNHVGLPLSWALASRFGASLDP